MAAKKSTVKAQKAYAAKVIKAYHRLEAVVAKHSPKKLVYRNMSTGKKYSTKGL